MESRTILKRYLALLTRIDSDVKPDESWITRTVSLMVETGYDLASRLRVAALEDDGDTYLELRCSGP